MNNSLQLLQINNTSTAINADIQQYIDKSCSEAVNRVLSVLLIQLLSNVTNANVSYLTDEKNNTNGTGRSKNLDILQLAIVRLLNDSQIIKDGIEKVLVDSKTFGDNVYENMINPIKKNGNIFFLLTMGIFIYFMQTGFALMEVGLVRTKNTSNSLWKNVSYSFASALGYWLCGMAISFGKDTGGFAGRTFWAFKDMPAADGNIDLMFYFFEYVFCTTAGAIMTGAIAERAQLGCYIIYTLIASAVTYPVGVHWAWTENGWLKVGGEYDINGEKVQVSYEDFAGSGVVHASGGVAALIAVIFVGPRIGRFSPNGRVNEIGGHSVTLVGAGAMTLFTGFLAFNAGSELAISSSGDSEPINRAAANTILSGTGGFMCVGLVYRLLYKRWLIIPMLCGGLAGNVAACCNCHTVEAWGAYCIGIFAGTCFMFVAWLLVKLRIDDAADAIGVHFGGGFAGCVGLALFKINVGIVYKWNKQSALMLGWQLAGFLAISLWSASNTYVMFYVMKMFNMVRVDPESELVGLDYAHGHELPYPNESYVEPNVHSGDKNQENGEFGENDLEKMYDELFQREMSKYTLEYINNPGWSHPVIGGVFYDLSHLSMVRSRRKDMQGRASEQAAGTSKNDLHTTEHYNGQKPGKNTENDKEIIHHRIHPLVQNTTESTKLSPVDEVPTPTVFPAPSILATFQDKDL